MPTAVFGLVGLQSSIDCIASAAWPAMTPALTSMPALEPSTFGAVTPFWMSWFASTPSGFGNGKLRTASAPACLTASTMSVRSVAAVENVRSTTICAPAPVMIGRAALHPSTPVAFCTQSRATFFAFSVSTT